MEINVLEQKKYEIELEIPNQTHTFCNLLKQNLWKNDNTKIAGYNIKHPLVGKPKLVIETSDKSAKKVLLNTAKSIKKELSEFKKKFKKAS